jgi:hypothetical protein
MAQNFLVHAMAQNFLAHAMAQNLSDRVEPMLAVPKLFWCTPWRKIFAGVSPKRPSLAKLLKESHNAKTRHGTTWLAGLPIVSCYNILIR